MKIEKIKQTIQQAVTEDEYLTLKTSQITEVVEVMIQYSLETVLSKHNREDLLDILYTIVKELLVNACKANHKRIYFEEMNLNINDEEDYRKGISEYRKILNESMAREYGRKSKIMDYHVILDFSFDESGLTIEVTNNSPIVAFEETLLRKKLKQAMQCNNIGEYYMTCRDEDVEGAGLGLALILILLKGVNIDPQLFRIFLQEDKTIARLEIPYTKRFEGKRDVA